MAFLEIVTAPIPKWTFPFSRNHSGRTMQKILKFVQDLVWFRILYDKIDSVHWRTAIFHARYWTHFQCWERELGSRLLHRLWGWNTYSTQQQKTKKCHENLSRICWILPIITWRKIRSTWRSISPSILLYSWTFLGYPTYFLCREISSHLHIMSSLNKMSSI